MAGGKQTPRQRLIGLMYLIFLALMALNVSVEVLDSFPLIDRGMEATNRNFETKVNMVYSDFEHVRREAGDARVEPFYSEALYIRELSDSLVNYIRFHRKSMLAELNPDWDLAQADTMDLQDSRRRDDYSFSSRYWLREELENPLDDHGGPGSRAYVLRSKILNLRSEIDSILAQHNQVISLALDVDDTEWQKRNFDRVINIAVATNLNRLIGEVRNAQFDAIGVLYDMIYAGDLRFDRGLAQIVPRSEVVMEGQSYEAEIFLAAIDDRQDPEIIVNGRRIPVRDGIGRLSLPATTPGEHTVSGQITLTTPDGPQTYRFSRSYTVQPPMAAVSATAMNALYVGVDNPLAISAAGLTSEQIEARISVGQLQRAEGGRFIARLPEGTTGDVEIEVYAIHGAERNLIQRSVFRAYPLPAPNATIAGRSEGLISRDRLAQARRISLQMPEYFLFDASYEVESFTLRAQIAGLSQPFYARGDQLTDEMRNIIQNARIGSDISIIDIVTKPGPDGVRQSVNPMIFTLQ